MPSKSGGNPQGGASRFFDASTVELLCFNSDPGDSQVTFAGHYVDIYSPAQVHMTTYTGTKFRYVSTADSLAHDGKIGFKSATAPKLTP